jgi:hypothetical protein
MLCSWVDLCEIITKPTIISASKLAKLLSYIDYCLKLLNFIVSSCLLVGFTRPI